MEKIKWTFILLLVYIQLKGQHKYFVYFKDKANSEYTIDKPQAYLSQRAINRRIKQGIKISDKDLPVNKNYLDGLRTLGRVRYSSKWLNAALVETNISSIEAIKALPFVKNIDGNNDIRGGVQDAHETLNYGRSETQIKMMGVDKMHEDGYLGSSMLIGVFDSGFQNGNSVGFLEHLFKEKKIQKTWDFVNHEENVYNDHSHGLNVLSCIAGMAQGSLIGTAPRASFVLFTTEDVATETRIEEVNWLFAAEAADSIGVDVVNSSLGYYDFDGTAVDYLASDLDGKKSISTQAAAYLASVGVVVCNSAGNEGAKPWRTIIAPADADGVLAVAAVDANKNRVSFSSIGPRIDGRIKPDVAAMGGGTTLGQPSGFISASSGTSFSSPLVAGFAAGLWEAFPDLTSLQITDLIKKTASQASNPDGFLGYGIPNYESAKVAANLETIIKNIDLTKDFTVFSNPFTDLNILRVIISDEKTFTGPYSYKMIGAGGYVALTGSANERIFKIENTSSLPSGQYILQITGNNAVKSIKVVKI